MAVNQLCGKAHRIRGHRCQSALIHGPGSGVGDAHLKAQAAPKSGPEGRQLPEGQYPRKADYRIPVLMGTGGWVILEQKLFPEGEEILRLPQLLSLFLYLGDYRLIPGVSHNLPPLAAVVGDPMLSIGERENGTLAVIDTEGTGGVLLLAVSEILHGVQADEGLSRLLSPLQLFLAILLCHKGGPDGPHHPGVGGPHHFTAQILLQGPQNGVVLERAALHYNFISQRVQIGHPDYLGKHIFNDGAAKARHNIRRLLAVSLGGDDAAVHEHGAAAAQQGRAF